MARYERVADTIREQITDGRLRPGDQLPTEPNFVREYGVSRLTVRHALDVLQAEGLIERVHGRGTFVRRPPRRMTYVGGWPALEAEAEEAGTETYVNTNSVRAEPPVTGLMQVEPGTELVEYFYLGLRDKRPYSLARVYVAHDVADRLGPPVGASPWGDEVRLGLVAAGVQLARVTERVTTRSPSQDEASRLHLPSGGTVLEVERTSQDDRGQVVEGARLVMPGDRIEIVYTAVPAAPAGR